MSRALITALLVLTVAAPAATAAENEPAAVDLSAAGLTIVLQPEPQRPAPLMGLYASFVALQVLDARTTTGALSRGAHEINPLLGTGSSGATWAVKAASTASTIFFVERIWKKNRIRAVLVMAGINAGYAALAAHNARQAR
jgi:hypothetical protein